MNMEEANRIFTEELSKLEDCQTGVKEMDLMNAGINFQNIAIMEPCIKNGKKGSRPSIILRAICKSNPEETSGGRREEELKEAMGQAIERMKVRSRGEGFKYQVRRWRAFHHAIGITITGSTSRERIQEISLGGKQ